MICRQSDDVERFMGRLEPGESIAEGFLDLARRHSISDGWIRAFGTLEMAQIENGGEPETTVTHVNSIIYVSALNGSISLQDGAPTVHMQLVGATADYSSGRAAAAGLVAGRLIDGRSQQLEFVVESFHVTVDSQSKESPLPEDDGQPEHAVAVSWADVAQASAVAADHPEGPSTAELPRIQHFAAARDTGLNRVQPSRPSMAQPSLGQPSLGQSKAPTPSKQVRSGQPTPKKNPTLKRGDWVDHKQFGVCRIDRVTGEGALTIKLPNARRKAIRLDFLDVLEPRREGERWIYPLRKKPTKN